jgi:DNA-directed RNA polymerase specialized sigma24 family protein
VQAAVRSLPEEQREVILLAKYQGLSYAEVAATLGISEAAAKQRAYRALQSLKSKLKTLDGSNSTGSPSKDVIRKVKTNDLS